MRSVARVLAFAVAVIVLSGCAGFDRELRKEAATDLNCSEDRIMLEPLYVGSFWRATGCDRSLVYQCAGCQLGAGGCRRSE